VGAGSTENGRGVRVAVIDMGTNSTRLLVAEVAGDRVTELARRTAVTRLGRGVDTAGHLAMEAIEDVCHTVGEYIATYEAFSPDHVVAVATSAVRDADNASAFTAELRERFALDARILDGAEEARLTYLGASLERDGIEETLVVDIGGGSTELVVGSGPQVGFHASIQAGTVRHSERHLKQDPPSARELEDLADDVRGLIDAELEGEAVAQAARGIAVAGTPTSLAAIDQQLDPYDPARVHGYRLSLASIQRMCSTLSSMPLFERLQVKGLHPGRAPTIVAGVVILIQVMRAFGLEEIEVSERDILHGAAIEGARALAR
jgi:exopolyphosphatase / guanosine-5'-triphosphate,3'-diphosphate pyrophosphatase